MNTDTTTLKTETIPALFANPRTIGEYGQIAQDGVAMTQLSDLMEAGTVTQLAEALAAIVAKLQDADPRRIAKRPSWLDRLTGKQIEAKERYRAARSQLDKLLKSAETAAQGVSDALDKIHTLMQQHQAEVASLRMHIDAGRDYLAENAQAGVAAPGSMEFDKPRERFARKLTNLATLLASHEMSLMQLKLTQATAMDMLDRFGETTRVLVPVWRQHTLALTTAKHMDPEMLAMANRAHDALVQSLTLNEPSKAH